MLQPPSPHLRIAARLHWLLGHALWSWGWEKGAWRAFGDAVRTDPRLIDAHLSLGDSFARDRQWGEAALAYRDATRSQPSNVDAQGNLILALVRAGRPARAVEAIDGLIRARAGDPLPHLLRGALLLKLGRRAEAIHSFRWAAQLRVVDDDGRFTLGSALVGPTAWRRVVEQHRQARDLEAGPGPAKAERSWSRLNTNPGHLSGRREPPPSGPASPDSSRDAVREQRRLTGHPEACEADTRCLTGLPAGSSRTRKPPAPALNRRREIRSLNVHRVWRARRAASALATTRSTDRATAGRRRA